MTLAQSHFRARDDDVPLNSPIFTFALDRGWTQSADRVLRVRFEIDETADAADTVTGQLEASLNGGSYFNVTATSGTVQAAVSEHFGGVAAIVLTEDVIQASPRAFKAGTGCYDGLADSVALDGQHTEIEYALRVLGDDVASGGTVALRVADLDSYDQTPSILVSTYSDRDRVRLMIGDTDSTDPKLTDAEIQRHVAAWPDNLDLAAAGAAEAIAAEYAAGYNFASDGQTFNRRERHTHYINLARELRRRGGTFAWPRS